MGKFVIKKRSNGEFQFNLHANNGQIILSSEGYASKAGCENGISSTRVNAQDDSRFERKISTSGKPYFNLKAANGQVIGASEMYESAAAREGGIASVKVNSVNASVEDQSV